MVGLFQMHRTNFITGTESHMQTPGALEISLQLGKKSECCYYINGFVFFRHKIFMKHLWA